MAVQQFLMMAVSATNRQTITGSLWTFGDNDDGKLGDGSTTRRSEPVQIGSLTNWQNTNYGCSEAFQCVIKDDGTLWSWGYNGRGQLGDGSTTSRSSPIQVGALTDWSKAYTFNLIAAAIKTDGTLWTWGYNGYGSLGLGDNDLRCSPTQVGSLTDWAHIIPNRGLQMTALKTDGTLWWWGAHHADFGGEFNSPVQIGSATDYTDIRCVGANATRNTMYYIIKEA